MDHGHFPGSHLSIERLAGLRKVANGIRMDLSRSEGRTGGLAGRKRGQGSDMRELRTYAEGDDLRHVDAMASARTGRLQVRTFQEDQDKRILLVADFRPPMLWGTRRRLRSVAAAEALAIAGWHAIMEGARTGLLAINARHAYHVAPENRDKAMMRIAGALARAHDEALADGAGSELKADTLATVLDRAARLAPAGSTVYCATGLDDPGADFADVAGSLARRTKLVFLLVQDAMEHSTERAALPFLPFGPSPSAVPRWGMPGKADPRLAIVPKGASVMEVDAAASDDALLRARQTP